MTMKQITKNISFFLFLFSASQTLTNAKQIIKDEINCLWIGQSISSKNITIYPLFDAQKVIKNRKNYTTFTEASKKGWITIKEIGSGTVNTVKIKNSGKKPVFIRGGSIITGAKQDRTTKQHILLPARSGWTEIPVFCVEHHRWNHVSPEFKSEDLIIPSSLRKTVEETGSQSEVWSHIDCMQKQSGIKSGTGTIVDNYKDKNTQKELNSYVEDLLFDNLPSSTVGIAVFIDDELIAIELFSSNKLLRKFWEKLVRSYAMDASIAKQKKHATPQLGGALQVQPFLNIAFIETTLETIKKSPQTIVANPGLGTLVKLESHRGNGSALINENDELIHLSYFPNNINLTLRKPLGSRF